MYTLNSRKMNLDIIKLTSYSMVTLIFFQEIFILNFILIAKNHMSIS
jgi:hypothetical protein